MVNFFGDMRIRLISPFCFTMNMGLRFVHAQVLEPWREYEYRDE